MGTVEAARLSHGTSAETILQRVAHCLAERHRGRGTIVDLGCGTGRLWTTLQPHFDQYIGVDAVRYSEFPEGLTLIECDLDNGCLAVEDAIADVVVSVETIEHLENPRAFVRTAMRILKPGGWLVITTPNQLSLLSKASLVWSNEFPAFKERPGLYPSHITALLHIDLLRIARETGLVDVEMSYSQQGRIPLTSRHYPHMLSRRFPTLFSDNVLLVARKPKSGTSN